MLSGTREAGMDKKFFILLMLASAVFGDEIRPAFLELTQQNETSYKVLWKKLK